jgi:hypothetical protein
MNHHIDPAVPTDARSHRRMIGNTLRGGCLVPGEVMQ